MRVIKTLCILLLAVAISSCANEESKKSNTEKTPPSIISFNPDTLKIPDAGGRRLRGQVLYMPVYLSIPSDYKEPRGLSALLAVHNTDLKHQIKITKVDLFNTDGELCKSLVMEERRLTPLATAIFNIPKGDQSGTGANFIIEWIAEQPVNLPLVETIMTEQGGNLGFSFLSAGRVIRELE